MKAAPKPARRGQKPYKRSISFDVSIEDASIIRKIATRAHRDFAYDVLHTEVDITATHRNGNPLRLADLLAADKFNFAHDVGGIARHLDRNTGKLMNHFLPRFSAKPAKRGQQLFGHIYPASAAQ